MHRTNYIALLVKQEIFCSVLLAVVLAIIWLYKQHYDTNSIMIHCTDSPVYLRETGFKQMHSCYVNGFFGKMNYPSFLSVSSNVQRYSKGQAETHCFKDYTEELKASWLLRLAGLCCGRSTCCRMFHMHVSAASLFKHDL